MKQSQSRPDFVSQGDVIETPAHKSLQPVTGGAAVIAAGYRIVHVNSRLAPITGPVEQRRCYEAFAGLQKPCPFCPFDRLIKGTSRPVRPAEQIRGGTPCLVSLSSFKDDAGNGYIVETVSEAPPVSPPATSEEPIEARRSDLSKKLEGLLQISHDLMGSAPFDKKMARVLADLSAVLDRWPEVRVWAEVDGKSYGQQPGEPAGALSRLEIRVGDQIRGHLSACCARGQETRPEDDYFLEEIAGLIGRQVEISDLEAKLRESQERYKRLARNLSKEVWTRTEAFAKETTYLGGILRCCQDMIITTDLDSRIVEFNPGAEKMTGYTAEEVQGRPAGELWEDPAERDRIVDEVIVSGGVRNYETRLSTKSGGIVEISLTLSLLKDEEGNVIGTVGVSKDIGKEKAVLRELERLNTNYREAIHFINHENKNSLVVMSGFLRRLIKHETDAAKLRELKIVYHHSQFLEAMSRDFLVMAELEHGQIQFRKQLINDFSEEVIMPAMTGLKERYPDSFESYDLSMGGVGRIQLQGDPALLEIVYRNLFGNALKYRYPEGKIAFGVRDLGDRYLFNVWNAGPGVPYDQVERIFEKFYRVPDETTLQKRGTGLGLYNIRKIIEAHGGRIWCETNPGVWVNFLFELPIQ